MKLSLKWAQQYTSTDLVKEDPDKLVEKIGAQIGAIDDIQYWGEKLEGIIVVKIVKCEPHPNADNLKLCWVDDGQVAKNIDRDQSSLVQIVCGGPNAKADMFAAWIPPGVTVPSSLNKEKLVLESREIRGQISNGMLASSSELGISEEHNGILEIRAEDIGREPTAGEPFKKLYDLDDIVVDIENKMLTHRPDLFGTLGLARELSGINNQKFTSPEWYLEAPADAFKQTAFEELKFSAENKAPELVPRFLTIAMSDIKVSPSPYWLQATLSRVGIKPINNVVDITNFVMHLTGQPLHAFDYDKVAAKGSESLIARMANDSEELTLLGGKTIKLDSQNVVIASGDGPAIALGGIMGGSDTEVSDITQNIIIECANFDMYNVRKTSMQYGLFTDAATRFTKGQSPLQNDKVLAYAINLMSELAGGKTASKLYDLGSTAKTAKPLSVSADFINERLGLNLSETDIVEYLQNIEIGIEENNQTLTVIPPFWRTDLEIAEDIVEEVGRLHGYDKLPNKLPKKDLTPAPGNNELELKTRARQILVAAGANEVLTYSFINEKLVKSSGHNENLAYHIRNALSPDLQYYRQSLLPSLYEKIHPNAKLGYKDFALFEIGKSHLKSEVEDNLPKEQKRLAFALNESGKQPPYYRAKYFLNYLLNNLHITNPHFEPLPNCHRSLSPAWSEAAKSYEPVRSAAVMAGTGVIGIVGEPTSKLKRGLKLGAGVAGFELDFEALVELMQTSDYQELNKYPTTQQDFTLRLSDGVSFDEVNKKLIDFFDLLQKEKGYGYKLTTIDIFAKDSDVAHKNLTWRVELWHSQKTLTTDESNLLIDELGKFVKNEMQAEKI